MVEDNTVYWRRLSGFNEVEPAETRSETWQNSHLASRQVVGWGPGWGPSHVDELGYWPGCVLPGRRYLTATCSACQITCWSLDASLWLL